MRAVRGLGSDRERLLRWLGTGVWLLACASLLASLAVWALRGTSAQSLGPTLGAASVAAILLAGLVYATVGAFLVRRSAWNPIGWLFLGVGVGMALLLPVDLLLESSVHAFRPVPSGQLFLAWTLSTIQLPASGAAVIIAVLLFPTGRAEWPRSGRAIALAVAGAALLATAAAVWPRGLMWYTTMPNPLAVPSDLSPVVSAVSLAGLAALVGAFVAAGMSLVWRYRNGDARQRRQLLWVMLGSTAMAGTVAVLFVIRYVGAVSAAETDALLLVASTGASFLPLSMVRFTTVTESHGQEASDLTFLFTDLQDSTAMYERVGDTTAFDLVRLHFVTLEAATRRNRGAIVKTIGDAIMARFPDPAGAVQTALEMFERLDHFNRRSDTRLILKVGLHRGDAIVTSSKGRSDYFGQTVNVAARVGAVARAGEIVLTEDVYGGPGVADLLEGRVAHHERTALKGVAGEVGIYRIVAAPAPTVPGPPQSPAGPSESVVAGPDGARSTPIP